MISATAWYTMEGMCVLQGPNHTVKNAAWQIFARKTECECCEAGLDQKNKKGRVGCPFLRIGGKDVSGNHSGVIFVY